MVQQRRNKGFKPSRWKREFKRIIRDPEQLARLLKLDAAATADLIKASQTHPLAISPRILQKMRDERDPQGPLHRQFVPSLLEMNQAEGESLDPLSELQHQAAPGLVHRYADRALLLLTGRCASYCRFCTRARLAETPDIRWEPALEYIRNHKEIQEVILSGGDPLMLSDHALDLVLRELRTIAHVEIIRLGTRMPVFVPRRITAALTRILARARPLFVLVHVNHASEMGKDFSRAVGRFVDAGLPVLSQTVLMRGINDDTETLATLFRALLRARVTPYYLHSVDLAAGTSHLRVDVDRGIELVTRLRDSMSGLAVPDYVIDLPEAGGKVLLAPDRISRRDATGHWIRAIDGREIFVAKT